MSKKETIYPFETFGGKIQHYRIEKGFSRPSFFDAIKGNDLDTLQDSKQKTVKMWESGKVMPSRTDLIRICDVLEVDADHLLRGMKARNHDIKAISDYVGLSCSSVEKLQKGKKAICSCPEWIAIPSDLEKDRAKRKAERLLVVLNLIIENDDLSDAIYEYLRIGKDGAKQIVFGKDNSSLHVAGSDQLNIININGVRIDSDIINKALQDRLINALNEVQRNNDIPAIDYSVFGMTSSGKELTATEIKE